MRFLSSGNMKVPFTALKQEKDTSSQSYKRTQGMVALACVAGRIVCFMFERRSREENGKKRSEIFPRAAKKFYLCGQTIPAATLPWPRVTESAFDTPPSPTL